MTDLFRLLVLGAADVTVERLGPAPYPPDVVGWWSWVEEMSGTACAHQDPAHRTRDTPPPCAACRYGTHLFVREAQAVLANVPPGPEVPSVGPVAEPSGFPPASVAASGTNMADGPGGSPS